MCELSRLLIRPGQPEGNLGAVQVPGPGRAADKPSVKLHQLRSECASSVLGGAVVTHHHRCTGEVLYRLAVDRGRLLVGLDQLPGPRQGLRGREIALAEVGNQSCALAFATQLKLALWEIVCAASR